MNKVIKMTAGFTMALAMICTAGTQSNFGSLQQNLAYASTSADFSISQNGVNFICEREGFSPKCYYDGNQSSIGYGTKCGTSAHSSGQHSITREAAMVAMMNEINSSYVPNVRRQTAGIQMNQNQFDALVSFTYNTGGGTAMIKNSPLVKYLTGALSESEARSQFSNYIVTNSATGKVDQGLINRRKAEANLFFSGSSVSSFPGEEDNSYSVPISVTASKKVNTYDGNGNIESNRWIDAGDNCTIDKVYKNGFVHIGYPTSSGTRWAYAKKEDFNLQPSSRSPEGVVDVVTGGAGTVYVRGWGFDHDNMGASIDVHVYLRDSSDNMIGVGAIKADKQREDVNNVHGCGNYHGYEDTLKTDAVGNFHVMIALIDTSNSAASWIDGGEVTITPGDSTSPVVSNVKYSKITPTGFTVQCTATDDTKIKEVKVAIWINDITEPVWHDCVPIGNDMYSFDFDISSYDNKNGPYNCHIYAWDENGNQAFGATEPIIVSLDAGDNFNAFIKHPESDKFVIAAATDNDVILHDSSNGAYATKRVWNFSKNPDNSYRITSYYNNKCLDTGGEPNGNIYTWASNDQDTQKWFIVREGDSYRLMSAYTSELSMDIEGGSHENGTEIRLWENNNSSAQKFSIEKISDSTPPIISDVTISDVTKDGYKVTIKVSDNVGIKKIAVPTWSQYNGQDDLFNDWTNTALATQINDDTWEYYVKLSEHNNERGTYYTDIYAWDFSGNETAHRGENKLRHIVEVGMYTLTVDPNGGTIKIDDGKNDTTDAFTYSTKLIYNGPNYCSLSGTYPKRAGYTFTGFYDSATGGTKIYGADGKCLNEGKYFKDGLYQQTSDLTVYAQWQAESVTGDVNEDGQFDDSDLILLQKWLLGVPNIKLGNWKNADMCGDGVLDVFDMVEMRRVLALNK